MEMIEAGMFARSKAGHDKGRMYIVLRLEGDYVYLADGRHRMLENPKRKNVRHIQICHVIPPEWTSGNMTNEAVKRAIKHQLMEEENV